MADAALENRVSALEQEVEGEKLVTRHILEQTRHNGNDIAAVRVQLGRMEGEMRSLRTDFGTLRNEFGALRNEFGTLRKDLPTIIAETMREVLRDRHR